MSGVATPEPAAPRAPRALRALPALPIGAALPASVALAVFLPTPLPLAILPPLVLLPHFARDIAAGRPASAARRTLVWALLLSALTIAAVCAFPERMESRVLHGPSYREEMFRWIDTGIGKESDPGRFIPEHIAHLALLLVLSFATGGAAGLLLGAVLLNYMNFYVASLVLTSNRPLLTLGVGWPVWSVVRVVGFIFAACAVAAPFYDRFRGVAPALRRNGRLLAAGLALAALDIVLKTVLAEPWRRLLEWSLQ
jgi:hypothetical protein